MKAIYLLVFIILTGLLVAAQTPQQDMERLDQYGNWIHGEGEPWSMDSKKYTSEQAKVFRKRWADLEKATKETTDEWAGEYSVPGAELSVVSLRWTSESGFAFLYVNTCMAKVMILSYGGVYADSAEVMLLPEISLPSRDKRDEYFLEMLSPKYIPVKWDGLHYLIAEGDLKNFFDRFAGRVVYREDAEPKSIRLFRKSGDEGQHESLDNMIVPYGYDKYIRKPIQASITKVGKEKITHGTEEFDADEQFVETTVVINAGSAKGVKVGMEFGNLSSENDDSVKVKRVFKDYSTGVITRPLCGDKKTEEEDESCENLRKNKIKAGWKLTTLSIPADL